MIVPLCEQIWYLPLNISCLCMLLVYTCILNGNGKLLFMTVQMWVHQMSLFSADMNIIIKQKNPLFLC